MTAEIPSWMTRGGRGRGLGEMGDQKAGPPRETLLVDDPDFEAETAMQDPNSPPPAPRASEGAKTEDDVPHSDAARPQSPEDAASQAVLAAILPKLVGVRSVVIRVYGNDSEAGPALQELLRRRGMDVKISSITQIVPPPLSKLSVRYQGVDATITLAPDLEG